MSLPANVDTGRVEGRFIVGVVDGPDQDLDPDGIPAQGTITFTSSVPYLPDPFASPAPVTILKAPITGVLDSEGYLCTPDPADPTQPGYRGLRLIATDDPDLSVTGWTWTVTYNFQRVAGVGLSIPSHSMALPAGATVDLTTVVKVPSSKGIGIEQAEALAATAAAAATEAAAAARAASEAASATDAGVATLLTSGEQTAPLLAAKVDRGALYVEASDFGAVGDGVTDDTAALQAWLDAPGPVRRLHDGIYRITAPLVSSEPGRRIIMDGATLIASTPDMGMLDVTGDDCYITPHLDGAGIARYGLHVTGAACEVAGGRIRDFSSDEQTTGIRADTVGGIHIHHTRISDVHSTGNGTIGDGPGASRAITIAGTGGPATGNNIIDTNILERITGEEGDAIHLVFDPSPAVDAKARITGNIIRDVSRRAVKLQAGGVVVANNVYEHDGAAPTAPSALIDVQYASDCDVTGNVLDARHFTGIQVTGTAADPAARTTITGNRVTGSGATVYGINAIYCTDLVIGGNTVRDAIGPIRAEHVAGLIVEGNTLRGGDPGAFTVGIKVVANCTKAVVRGNVAFDGPRTVLVENGSPGALVEGNYSHAITNTNVIRGTAQAVGSVYRANSSTSPGIAAFGPLPNQSVSQTYNSNAEGQAGAGADVLWTTGDPTTALPGRVSSRGDIAYNRTPAAGGVLGWVCVTAGTPGTWKAIGTIAV